jgi:hypothetical protein
MNSQKLVSTFRPAFDEASEISFVDSHSSRRLNILIRKNYRLDETEDTFYFKTVALDEVQTKAVQTEVLNRLDSSVNRENNGIRDGIWIYCQHIQNGDTSFYTIHSPAQGTTGYELTAATLDTYQHIFRDTLISDYFNDLRTYINHKGYVEPKRMTPLKQMREKQYAGLMKYSR